MSHRLRLHTLAGSAIILLSLNIRTSVTAVSAIIDPINAGVHFTATELSLLGTIAPISFAICGIVVPRLSARIGLERLTAISAILMAAALVLRSFVVDAPSFLIATTLSLLGMGVGNITLPPLVKRYYPLQMALMTSIYSTALAMSATLPPLIAVPLTRWSSWRIALLVWAVFGVISVVPWVMLATRRSDKRSKSADAKSVSLPPVPRVAIIHSRIAWAVTLGFTASTITAYFMFAWLPTVSTDIGDLTPLLAGLTLSGFAILGIPIGFFGPILAVKFGLPRLFVISGAALVIGYAGLLVAPQPLFLLWILLIGLGPLLYPVCLTAINLRTESITTAGQLSGFAQSISYGTAGVLIFVFRWIQTTPLGWTPAFVFLAVTGLVAIVAAMPLRRPVTIEQDLATR